MKTIADRLKKGMALRGLKQSDLAAKTGISKGALSSYVSGKYEPKQQNIYKISKALDVNEAWLMGLDVSMERNILVNDPGLNEILIKISEKLDVPIKELEKEFLYDRYEIPTEITESNILAFIEKRFQQKKREIHELTVLLNRYPDSSVKPLAILCKKERIEKDLTERFVSKNSNIDLNEYLEFENNNVNIGADKIINILTTLDFTVPYIIGFLTGVLFDKTDIDRTNQVIDEMFIDNEIINKFMKLFIELDSEQVDLLKEEMEKMVGHDKLPDDRSVNKLIEVLAELQDSND